MQCKPARPPPEEPAMFAIMLAVYFIALTTTLTIKARRDVAAYDRQHNA